MLSTFRCHSWISVHARCLKPYCLKIVHQTMCLICLLNTWTIVMLFTIQISNPAFLTVLNCFANGSPLLFEIIYEVCILVIVSLMHVSLVLITQVDTLLWHQVHNLCVSPPMVSNCCHSWCAMSFCDLWALVVISVASTGLRLFSTFFVLGSFCTYGSWYNNTFKHS